MFRSARMIGPVASLLLIPAYASACGDCIRLQMLDTFPPTMWWTFTGIALYLAASFIIRFRAPSPFAPVFSRVFAIISLVLSLGIGAAMIGPLPFLVILGMALLATASVALEREPEDRSRRTRAQIIGTLAIAALVLSASATVIRRNQLDEVERILANPLFPSSERLVQEMINRRDLESLHRLVFIERSFLPSKVIRSIGEFGTPEKDGPLLIGALRLNGESDWLRAGRIADALHKLYGVAPDDPRDPEAWEAIAEAYRSAPDLAVTTPMPFGS